MQVSDSYPFTICFQKVQCFVIYLYEFNFFNNGSVARLVSSLSACNLFPILMWGLDYWLRIKYILLKQASGKTD